MTFVIVSLLYLGFLGFMFWMKYRKSNVSSVLVENGKASENVQEKNPTVATGVNQIKAEGDKEKLGGAAVSGAPENSPVKDVSRVSSGGITITIDPLQFTNSVVIERDDEGGIIIKSVPNGIVYNAIETLPLKSEEEMNMAYLESIEEVADSVREWGK